MKVISGHVKHDATMQNTTRGASERLGALHSMQGKQLDKIDEASAGDIIACVKLRESQTGDTLADKNSPIVYDALQYPEAAISFAIEPKSRQDEEKISVALHKILEEDPGLHFSRDAQTKEFILSGSGQLHVETVVQKLKDRYHVEVALHPPKILSTNSKPPPRSNGSKTTLQSPNCPRPPVCFLWRPCTSALAVIVSL